MDEKERKQYEKMVLTPVDSLIPNLAVPTVISMLITQIYNLADAYFVGKLGTSASASIGILLSVQAIFQAIGFMFGHGGGSIISRHLGMGNRRTANEIANLSFATALVISVIPAILGLWFISPLMRLLGSTPTILPYSVKYGKYILISGPALALSCVLNNIMRYEGRAFYAMIGLVSGGVLNMIGDPVLMFGLHMGIDGAGLSTAVSQYISLGILLYMFLSHKTICEIHPKYLRYNGRELRQIIQTGLPSLIRQCLNSVSSMTLNICAKPYGDAAIAAMAIVGRISFFMGSVMIGIGQGFQPVASYNYGAKKFARIHRAVRFTLISSEIVLSVIAVIMFLFPTPIVRFFRNDPEVIRIGRAALRLQCAGLILQPVSVVTNMLFQSIGESKKASFTASLRTGIYYIPVLLILPRLIGLTGIESAQMAADTLASFTCLPMLTAFLKKLPRKDEETSVDREYQRSQGSKEVVEKTLS